MRRSFRVQFLNFVTALRARRARVSGEELGRLKTPTGTDRSGRDRALKVLYRISDGGYKKDRFAFASKQTCLKNFLAIFDVPADDLLIIADNVGEATWTMVNDLHSNVVRTQTGSGSASWRHAAFDIALQRFAESDVVYFVEDDYLHLPGSRDVLLEGMVLADYVSLYDNSDKYVNAAEGGPNHFVAFGGELTRVVRTPSTHWKVTNSTTMTFATTVEILRGDWDLWDRFTRRDHPLDFQAFLALREKGRSLIVPLPGYSTHCEPRWATPGVDWESVASAYA